MQTPTTTRTVPVTDANLEAARDLARGVARYLDNIADTAHEVLVGAYGNDTFGYGEWVLDVAAQLVAAGWNPTGDGSVELNGGRR